MRLKLAMILILLLTSSKLLADDISFDSFEHLLVPLEINEDELYKSPDTVFNTEQVNQFPAIDFKEIDELTEKHNKAIQQIIESPASAKYTTSERAALQIKLEDIIKGGTFLATVVRGTHVVHVRTGKTYYLPKDIIVKAFKKEDHEGYQILQNKDGSITYKAPASYVVSIKEITALYEPPLSYTPVKEKITYDLYDRRLKYEAHFIANVGLTRPTLIRDILKNENHIGQTTRYESTVYGKWDFPVKLGLTGQYENHFGNLTDLKYNMQSLSLGPAFKSPHFKLFDKETFAVLQTRLAVFSRLAVNSPLGTENYRASQTSLVLGLMREYPSLLGKWLIGINYQRQWMKASAQSESLNIKTSNNTTDAFVVSLGLGTDWIW
jgi:hypothetical protein